MSLLKKGAAALTLAAAATGLLTTAASADNGDVNAQGFWGVEAYGLTWEECFSLADKGLRDGRWTNYDCHNYPPEQLGVTLYVYYV